MKIHKVLATFATALVVLIVGCKKDNFVEKVGVCPIVISTVPTNDSTGVPIDQIITVTFNEKMNPKNITQSSFTLEEATKASGPQVTGTLVYDGTTPTFSFAPTSLLTPNTTYKGTVSQSVRDLMGNALQEDYVWSFTTAQNGYTVSLSSNPSAGGTSTGGGSFISGASVTILATPNNGYTFLNWTEGANILSTNTSFTFTITGNRRLVANFVETGNSYNVNLSSNPSVGGTTTGGGSYISGASVTIHASPNDGYAFINWTEGANILSSNASFTFTITGNRTLVANFVETGNSYNVNLSSNPSAGGITTGGGSYISGASVTIQATPNDGYTFLNWTEGVNILSLNANFTFTISGNRTLVANFTESANTYTVALSSNPSAGGTTTGGGSYISGASVTIAATPNTGYTFTNWTEGTNVLSANASFTFTIAGNRTLVANFTESANNYTVALSSNPSAGGTTTGGGSYISGASVTIAATPNTGYTFTNWTEGTNVLSANASFTFTIAGNRTLVANFGNSTPKGPGVVNLGSAGNFVILTKSGISTTGTTSITGNIGVSPATSTAITGFGLILDATNQFATSPYVIGKVYAADYAPPTPANITTAISDLETAYTAGNGFVTAPIVELYAGNLNGQTLAPGLYKWSTGVDITTGITLAGGPNDTWIFQVAQDLTVASGAIITLSGGAQVKNIAWIVAGQTILETDCDFSGIILSQTLISMNTGAKVTGRLLAQTAVTLIASTIIQPN